VRSAPLLVAVALWPLVSGFGVLERRNAEVEQGNAALKSGKADEALTHYDKAVAALPADPGAHFNRGTALYALSRFDEAGEEFLRATQSSDHALKAAGFRNLGNAFAKKDKFKEAIEAYKRALALRSDDQEAKWNLEIALRKQEEEKKKQEQQDKDKDKKDQDKQGDKKDDKQDDKKDQKDDQKQDQKDKDKQGQQDQKDKEKDKQAPQDQDKNQAKDQPKPGEGDKQPPPSEAEKQQQEQQKEIDAVLGNLERSSKSLEQERARVRAVRRRPPAKDW
jgi:Ca-activated chloride channel family protein